MMLLLHGISLAEAPIGNERERGLRDQPLVRINSGVLVAHVTCWLLESRELDQQDLLAHHALMDRLHAREGACLPARFPTWVEDEHNVRETLGRRATEFSQALEGIRGRLELAITVLAESGPHPNPLPEGEGVGTRYMRERLHARRQANEVSAQLRRLVEPEAVELQESAATRPGVVLSLAVLVAKDSADELARRLRAATPEQQGIRILVNGPWPPYTFAVVQARQKGPSI
jgi:hypothetical protein